jgi:hypothetical protein
VIGEPPVYVFPDNAAHSMTNEVEVDDVPLVGLFIVAGTV